MRINTEKRRNRELHKVWLTDQIILESHSFLFHSPSMSKVGTVNIVNIIICVTIALLFDGAVVGGRESLYSRSRYEHRDSVGYGLGNFPYLQVIEYTKFPLIGSREIVLKSVKSVF